ncbi:hypothetical protein [Methanobrevibacter sp.]|uniref:hypothetical protein n=1 Tax=Methanobrevibacter sp. TaxID=66852 RepID=UPI0038654428
MDIKKVLVISLVLIMIVLSSSIVSAGWFDNGVNVNGIEFNLPDGYKEAEGNNFADNYLSMGYKGETGIYEDENGNLIWISVLNENPEGTELSLDDIVVSATDFEDLKNNTEIAGKTGISYKFSTPSQNAFVYVEDGKLIDIRVPDGVNFEDIIK